VEPPNALGYHSCFTARATPCGELEQATCLDTRTFIEVVTDAYEASPPTMKLHDSLNVLYKL
jgi:indolepyruvate decarboxylase